MSRDQRHPQPLVDVVGLSKRWGARHVIDDVSLHAGPGTHCLVGPNGAGKTTLLRLIAGDLRPDAGRVRVGDASTAKDRRSRVVHLPQHPQLHRGMTAVEFVAYCGWLRGMPTRSATTVAREVLSRVNLADRGDDKVGRLSGGMQRRVAIAAALVASPEVLLLDEPMSGLDPEQRLEVREVVRAVGESTVVVLATHVMQDLPGLSDHVVLLDQGEVRFDGDLDAFAGDEPDRSAEALERAFVRHLRREAS